MIKKGKSKEEKRLTQAGESIKGLKGIPAQACPGTLVPSHLPPCDWLLPKEEVTSLGTFKLLVEIHLGNIPESCSRIKSYFQ